MLYSFIIKLQ